MRITTTSLDDFIENLKSAEVFRREVHFERSSHPMNGKTKRDATCFAVVYQLSAVLDFGEDGQALLVCGIDCGVDRTTEDGGDEGTELREAFHERLKEFCEGSDLKLLPGVLDQ